MAPLIQSLLSRFGNRSVGATAEQIREEIAGYGLDAHRAVALSAALEREGNLLAALDTLVLANRMRRDAGVERRLVRLRRAAARELADPPAAQPIAVGASASAATEAAPDAVPFEFVETIPGINPLAAKEATADRLRLEIQAHGAVLVRGVVGPARVRRLVDAVDRAFAAYDAYAASASPAPTPWFDPLEDVPEVEALRPWLRAERAVLTGDSPRGLSELLQAVADHGVDRLVSDYLGARPVLSLEKCCLRRADPEQTGNAWHQDGAFLGASIRSLNMWLSLSECGRSAPGLDIVPARIERILPVGRGGALYDWDVGEDFVRRAYPQRVIWRPAFEPGDALFFDHLCIHRTALSPAMNRQRWAIESWFFAPSAYPASQTPLVV